MGPSFPILACLDSWIIAWPLRVPYSAYLMCCRWLCRRPFGDNKHCCFRLAWYVVTAVPLVVAIRLWFSQSWSDLDVDYKHRVTRKILSGAWLLNVQDEGGLWLMEACSSSQKYSWVRTRRTLHAYVGLAKIGLGVLNWIPVWDWLNLMIPTFL